MGGVWIHPLDLVFCSEDPLGVFIFSECLESECVSSAIIGLFIFIFFIRLDNILSCHMVMLQCSHQMSQCPSPMGNVVTFHLILLGCIKKSIHSNYKTKPHSIRQM